MDAACGKRRLALPAPPQKRTAMHLEVQGTAGPSAGGQAAAPPQHLAAAESDDEGFVDAVLSDTEAALQLLESQFQAKVRAAAGWRLHNMYLRPTAQ